MKKPTIATALGAAMICCAGAAPAADAERGKLLYENHCSECHTTGVHFRDKRKATSVADIRGLVARWQDELKLDWSASEIDDVSEHLNQRFYQFPDPQ